MIDTHKSLPWRNAMRAFAEEEDWVMSEFAGVCLGDARRTKRLIQIVRAISAQPSASFPEACGSKGALKACYRFFDTDALEASDLLEGHFLATRRRLSAESLVLVIQDTSELNYSHHPHTEGLGPLSRPDQQGLFMHSSFSMTAERVPLGLIAQKVWARPPQIGKARTRKTTRIEDKESYKWLQGLEALNEVKAHCPLTAFVMICDREADIFDLFAKARKTQVDLLVRATHDRKVDHEQGYLYKHVLAAPVVERFAISLPRRKEQKAREAGLSLRFGPVVVCPPKHRKKDALCPIALFFVHVIEESPPEGQDPVEWLLITSLTPENTEKARQILDFYTARWGIEIWHKILKSGCQIETRQLAKEERIERLIPVLSVIAFRVLMAVMLSRHLPDASCACLLDKDEWQALYCRIHNNPKPPDEPPSLYQAVLWIARLGGFIARKNDGHPGVTTLWRGFQHLNDLTIMFQIMKPSPVPPPPQKNVGKD